MTIIQHFTTFKCRLFLHGSCRNFKMIFEKITHLVKTRELTTKDIRQSLRRGREKMNGILFGTLLSVLIVPVFILTFPMDRAFPNPFSSKIPSTSSESRIFIWHPKVFRYTFFIYRSIINPYVHCPCLRFANLFFSNSVSVEITKNSTAKAK